MPLKGASEWLTFLAAILLLIQARFELLNSFGRLVRLCKRLVSLTYSAKRSIYHVCREFLVESAVLIFVFPVLDTIVEHGKEQVTKALVLGSFSISGAFLLGAIIMTMVSEE